MLAHLGERHSHLPKFVYHGAVFSDGADLIAANGNEKLKDTLMQLHNAGTYAIAGVTPTDSLQPRMATNRPVLAMDQFKNTFPRANGDLPLREAHLATMRATVRDFTDMNKDTWVATCRDSKPQHVRNGCQRVLCSYEFAAQPRWHLIGIAGL
jgi:hypothetical protein